MRLPKTLECAPKDVHSFKIMPQEALSRTETCLSRLKNSKM